MAEGGDTGRTALVVIDTLNTYEHEDAEVLVRSVGEDLPGIGALLERARDANAPVAHRNLASFRGRYPGFNVVGPAGGCGARVA